MLFNKNNMFSVLKFNMAILLEIIALNNYRNV